MYLSREELLLCALYDDELFGNAVKIKNFQLDVMLQLRRTSEQLETQQVKMRCVLEFVICISLHRPIC